MNNPIRMILAVALCSFALVGCKKKQDVKTDDAGTATDTTQTDSATDNGKYSPEDLETDSCLRQRVVYFDFDMSNIRPEFEAIMACHGKYLSDRPSAMVTLEGHADERGTREYNLGLGERRGNSASSALQANGGGAGQLTVVSYGEERSACTDSDEGCWSKNRRVEIVYTAK